MQLPPKCRFRAPATPSSTRGEPVVRTGAPPDSTFARKQPPRCAKTTFTELAQSIGIIRTTLSRMAGPVPFNTTTDNLDKLCAFFGCHIGELAEHVPDGAAGGATRASSRSMTSKSAPRRQSK